MKFSAFVLATAAATASAQFGVNPFAQVNFFQGAASPYPVQYQQQYAYPQQQQYVPYPVQQQAVDPLAWERDCTWVNSQNFRIALSRATCGTDNCVSPQGNGGGAKRSLSETGGFHVWGTVINRAGRVCAIAYTGTDVSQQFPFGRIQSAKKANTANSMSLPKRSAPNFLVSKFNRAAAAFHLPVNRRMQFGWVDYASSTNGDGTMQGGSAVDACVGTPCLAAALRYGSGNRGGNAISGTTAGGNTAAGYEFPIGHNPGAGNVVSARSIADGASINAGLQGAQGANSPTLLWSGMHMQTHHPILTRATTDPEYNQATFLPEFNYNTDRNIVGQDNYFRMADIDKIDNNRFGYMHRTNNGGASLNTWDDTAWHGFSMDESPGHLDVHYQGAASNYGEACGNTRQDPMCMQKPGGYDYHAGGLALYDAQGVLRGAIGVAGDNDCTNHAIAWKTREQLQMNYVPWVSQWFRTSPVNQLPVQDGANTRFGNVRLNSCPSCNSEASGEYRKGNVGSFAEDNIAFNQLYANPHRSITLDGQLATGTQNQDYVVELNRAIESWSSVAGTNRDLTGNNGGDFHSTIFSSSHWVPFEKSGFPTLQVEQTVDPPTRSNLYTNAAVQETTIVWGLDDGNANVVANRLGRGATLGLNANTPVFEGILRGQPDSNVTPTFNSVSVTANKVPFTEEQDKVLRRGDGPYPYCAVLVSNFYKTNPTKTSLYAAAKPAV